MIGNFPACVAFTLAEEGGYTDDPLDSGGPTNMGITQATLAAYFGRPASVDEVRALSQDTATRIYKFDYWHAVAGDGLPLGVDLMCFDFGVNSGPGNSARELQIAVGVTVDGDIGPITIAAAVSFGIGLIDILCARHKVFYRSLDGFAEFGDGWLARLARCEGAAKGMVAA